MDRYYVSRREGEDRHTPLLIIMDTEDAVDIEVMLIVLEVAV